VVSAAIAAVLSNPPTVPRGERPSSARITQPGIFNKITNRAPHTSRSVIPDTVGTPSTLASGSKNTCSININALACSS
jgi:hypothetical protein